MYKLDSVDAYEQKLVKQIEVAGVQVENSHNKAYILEINKAFNWQSGVMHSRITQDKCFRWIIRSYYSSKLKYTAISRIINLSLLFNIILFVHM